jgi:hypothetical protein
LLIVTAIIKALSNTGRLQYVFDLPRYVSGGQFFCPLLMV